VVAGWVGGVSSILLGPEGTSLLGFGFLGLPVMLARRKLPFLFWSVVAGVSWFLVAGVCGGVCGGGVGGRLLRIVQWTRASLWSSW
jgi:hypothetical protein